MRGLICIALLSLTACSSGDANIYGGAFGQRVVGNDNYVTVSNVWSEMDALPLAEGHCRKYGKPTRFNHMAGNRAIFDCAVR